MILDAGVLFRSIDLVALVTDATDPFSSCTSGATRLGATRDGNSFKSNKTIRPVQLDGIRGKVMGLDRVDAWDPVLATSLVEHSIDNVHMYFGHADATPHIIYTEIRPRLFIQNTDYIDNIALFATVNGDDNPVCLVLENILSVNAFNMDFKDKNETAVQIELTAHFDPADITRVPCAVYLPPLLQTSGS